MNDYGSNGKWLINTYTNLLILYAYCFGTVNRNFNWLPNMWKVLLFCVVTKICFKIPKKNIYETLSVINKL